MPAKASLDSSVVVVGGVPSNIGAFRTGSDTRSCLIPKNTLSWLAFHMLSSLWLCMLHWYACLPAPLGVSTAHKMSLRGFSRFVHPLTKSWK
jgi:hypothetical protein